MMKNKFFYLTTLLLVGVYFFSVVYSGTRTTTIELEFSAENGGTMYTFWPDKKNDYSYLNSQSTEYSAGNNVIRQIIPYFPRKLNLRIDPDISQNTIHLTRVSFIRSGVRTDLNADQIAGLILAVNSLDWQLESNALTIKTGKNDPILVFKRLPFPSDTKYWLTTLLYLLLLASVFRWMLRRAPGSCRLCLPGIIVFFLILFLFVSSTSYFSQYLILLIHAVPVLAMVQLVLYFERQTEIENRYSVIGSLLLIALFVLLLTGQMLTAITPGIFYETVTDVKNSYLENEDKGVIKAFKSARDTFESSLVDAIPLKEKLTLLNTESKIFVLGFSPSEKAIVGKDDWFFEGYGDRRVEKDIIQSFDNITDYMGLNPFTEAELQDWKVALEERYYWLKERGSRYIFALAPTKALVYPEKLPDRILNMKQKLNRSARYDQLLNYLSENSVVPVVDLRMALLKEKIAYPDTPLFYRTDFHWNYLGSFFAYRAIIMGINEAYPELKLKAGELNEFRIEKRTDWVHTGFMRLLGLDPERHKNDTYISLFPKPESDYYRIDSFSSKGIDDDTMPLSKHVAFGETVLSVRELTNRDGSLPLMFIIGDSFIEKTLGYFSKNSRKILNFRVVTSFPSAPYTEAGMKPDVVIQEILNMYLLNSPPYNPDGIKAARVRALEKQAD